MQNKNKGFIRGRLKAITYSLKGIKILITSEDSIKAQCIIGLFVTILGFIFKISPIEWMLQFLVIGLVLVAEALNTAIEKIADFIHPDYHNKIGIIKDVGAGAAGIAAIISIILASIIYIPKISILFS